MANTNSERLLVYLELVLPYRLGLNFTQDSHHFSLLLLPDFDNKIDHYNRYLINYMMIALASALNLFIHFAPQTFDWTKCQPPVSRYKRRDKRSLKKKGAARSFFSRCATSSIILRNVSNIHSLQ